MIELNRVSRWYGQVIGLNDVSCTIKPGLTALLGQNGAGKSTLLRLITGQIKPTTGSIRLFGEEPFANSAVYKKLGYCPDIDSFYEHNSGRQFIRFLADISGFDKRTAKDRTEEVIAKTGMESYADRRIAGYSKGMRQRVKLAQAMLVQPDAIMLDEPLNGLDPVARREYIDLLHSLAAEGKTIVVSSHILYEVETMTESLLLLHRGRLLAEGDLRVIRSLIDRHPHRVRIESENPRAIATELTQLNTVLSLEINDTLHYLEVEVKTPDSFYDFIAGLSVQKGLSITGFSSPDNNMESVFEYLVESR